MSNVQKLRKAGFKISNKTPKAYRDEIERLSDVEVALLTNLRPLLDSVNARLEQAQASQALKPPSEFFAPPPL